MLIKLFQPCNTAGKVSVMSEQNSHCVRERQVFNFSTFNFNPLSPKCLIIPRHPQCKNGNMNGFFSTSPARAGKPSVKNLDMALLLTFSVLYPALPRNFGLRNVWLNIPKTCWKFWLVKSPDCNWPLSSSNQQCTNRRLSFCYSYS